MRVLDWLWQWFDRPQQCEQQRRCRETATDYDAALDWRTCHTHRTS